jgi:hypothetical protein
MSTRRNYISAAEVNTLVGITPTDAQLDMAESMIDTYAGFIDKWLKYKVEGLAVSGGASTLTLMEKEQNRYDANYFSGCEIKILGGTGAGQSRRIASSTYAGVITVADAWTTPPDSTSFYRIYQFAKFPRRIDVSHFTEVEPYQVYKEIPELVKQAVAAQVEFINSMGEDFFSSDKSEKVRERIGDYEYENANGQAGYVGIARLIAPRVKMLLRGIRVTVGGC